MWSKLIFLSLPVSLAAPVLNRFLLPKHELPQFLLTQSQILITLHSSQTIHSTPMASVCIHSHLAFTYMTPAEIFLLNPRKSPFISCALLLGGIKGISNSECPKLNSGSSSSYLFLQQFHLSKSHHHPHNYTVRNLRLFLET